MSNNRLSRIGSLAMIVVAALIMAGCGSPTATPAPTSVPAAATIAATSAATTASVSAATMAATSAATMAATSASTSAATMAPTMAALGTASSIQTSGLTKIRLQSKWVVQAQFAGYYEAVTKGYFKDMGLDVTILPGGPDITPETVVASGAAEFGLDWLPSLLNSREQGTKLVNVAQIFARSGMREVSFVDKNIKAVTDLKAKKVGVWLGGNEFELFSALVKNKLDPQNPRDVTIVKQPFDMTLLLSGEVDAAAAMTYNEYAQVLESINPKTGKLYQPSDLNVLNFNDVGTGMLQDGIFANADWLAQKGNEDVAVKFIAASLKGWVYCRDNPTECVKTVLDQGPTLGAGHQTWQMNEVNKLIWPNKLGIGLMDADLYAQTVTVATAGKVITKAPDKDAYRTDLAQKAIKMLTDAGVDVLGSGFTPMNVILTEGGKTAQVAPAGAATTPATMAATMAMPATMAATTAATMSATMAATLAATPK